jgi:uracil-DNA glycosylase
LLYATLFKYGLSTAPVSTAADDGLKLQGARITNAVKCLPPDNKPLPAEIGACNPYLRAELRSSPGVRTILALGSIAHQAVLRACELPLKGYRFAHGAEHRIDADRVLVDSYHCSRYNTQTRRLTTDMFETVVERACSLAAGRSIAPGRSIDPRGSLEPGGAHARGRSIDLGGALDPGGSLAPGKSTR